MSDAKEPIEPLPGPTGSVDTELMKARSIGNALAAALMGEYSRADALGQWAADLKLPDNQDLADRLKTEGIPVEKWERIHAKVYPPKGPGERPANSDAGSLDPVVRRRLSKAIQIDNHGTPDAQKNALVNEILNTFGNPDKWPMDDGSRISFLKGLYRRALIIRETEEACAAS